jgi:hypothetical protein
MEATKEEPLNKYQRFWNKICDECGKTNEYCTCPAECDECGEIHPFSECGECEEERAFPMTVENLNEEALEHLREGMEILDAKTKQGEYFEVIKGIMQLMKMFEEDIEFHKILTQLRDDAKNMWREEMKRK